jgi:hypothetical protein
VADAVIEAEKWVLKKLKTPRSKLRGIKRKIAF